jgi:hypothetical protein
MNALNEEQQAALRKFKQDVLGVATEELLVPPAAPRTPPERSPRQRTPRPTSAPEKSRSKTARPAVLFSDVVRETGVPWKELVEESRRSGIQLNPSPGRTRLFDEEAQHLRRFAALRKARPLLTASTYTPDPEGRISLEDYDRLEPRFAAKLLVWGYLPARKDLKAFPSRSWAGIVRHHRRLEVLGIQQERKAADLRRLNGNPVGPHPYSEPLPTSSPTVEAKPSKAPAAGVPSPVAAEIKRQLDARRHRREIDPESKPEPAGIKVTTPRTDPVATSIGPGNPALDELQLTLSAFAPKDHPVFFESLAAALELDERNVKALSADADSLNLTDRALRNLIRHVCNGKFGLFAYHDVSNTLRSAARRNSLNASPVAMKNALTNLRPMHTGVLTDAGKSRFVFWHVEQDGTQLAVITFRAMSDWVQGMSHGQYVPLRGRLVTVSRHWKLTEMEREDAQFMVEAALKLRKGIHIRRSAPISPEPRERDYLNVRAAPPQRILTYKPHSDWLIPVVIENGFATAGLQEGFFSHHGGRSAHEVRAFMRRAPGTSWNAPRTIQVSAHMRGGYDVGDIGFMPTVTIMREMNAHST